MSYVCLLLGLAGAGFVGVAILVGVVVLVVRSAPPNEVTAEPPPLGLAGPSEEAPPGPNLGALPTSDWPDIPDTPRAPSPPEPPPPPPPPDVRSPKLATPLPDDVSSPTLTPVAHEERPTELFVREPRAETASDQLRIEAPTEIVVRRRIAEPSEASRAAPPTDAEPVGTEPVSTEPAGAGAADRLDELVSQLFVVPEAERDPARLVSILEEGGGVRLVELHRILERRRAEHPDAADGVSISVSLLLGLARRWMDARPESAEAALEQAIELRYARYEANPTSEAEIEALAEVYTAAAGLLPAEDAADLWEGAAELLRLLRDAGALSASSQERLELAERNLGEER